MEKMFLSLRSKHTNNGLKSAVAVLILVSALAACDKEDQKYNPTTPTTPTTPSAKHSEYYEANTYARSVIFDKYYYWADAVRASNAKLNPDQYTSKDFFSAMLYNKDRWSWCADGKSYGASSSVDGTWGISLGQPVEYYDDYGPYVKFIYPSSPLAKFSVTRGAHLTKISDVDVSVISSQYQINAINAGMATSPQMFTFRLVDGRDTTFTASWSDNMEYTTSLGHRIFTADDFEGLDAPVGYFNYLSFNERYLTDIDKAMMDFREAGIRKLIIDLRYNGGGSSVATQRIMDYLTPEQYTGEVYSEMEFNDLLAAAYKEMQVDSKNYVRTLKNSFGSDVSEYSNLGTYYKILDKKIVKPLELEEIYFIAGGSSASASEKLINEMEPFLKGHTHIIGEQSYGKPNGMVVFLYPDNDSSEKAYRNGEYEKIDYIFLPISFYTKNRDGGYIPDDGFEPDVYRADDLYHDFDENEASIYACLTHIVTGVFPEPPATTKTFSHSGVRADLRILPYEKDETLWNMTYMPCRNDIISEEVK